MHRRVYSSSPTSPGIFRSQDVLHAQTCIQLISHEPWNLQISRRIACTDVYTAHLPRALESSDLKTSYMHRRVYSSSPTSPGIFRSQDVLHAQTCIQLISHEPWNLQISRRLTCTGVYTAHLPRALTSSDLKTYCMHRRVYSSSPTSPGIFRSQDVLHAQVCIQLISHEPWNLQISRRIACTDVYTAHLPRALESSDLKTSYMHRRVYSSSPTSPGIFRSQDVLHAQTCIQLISHEPWNLQISRRLTCTGVYTAHLPRALTSSDLKTYCMHRRVYSSSPTSPGIFRSQDVLHAQACIQLISHEPWNLQISRRIACTDVYTAHLPRALTSSDLKTSYMHRRVYSSSPTSPNIFRSQDVLHAQTCIQLISHEPWNLQISRRLTCTGVYTAHLPRALTSSDLKTYCMHRRVYSSSPTSPNIFRSQDVLHAQACIQLISHEP